MLSLLIAAALLQAAPDASGAAQTAARESNLPKDDYGLVAWCHGALAGQLELDGVAKADMEKIEGKAKVAARAKNDAELEKARRQYLKDYEHALAAAEAASPVAIHQRGVLAEQQGYKLWTGTRNKEPIWRMLDWGIWDANDAGCGDAAKRLYERSTLLGVALKNTDTASAPAKVEDGKADEGPAKAGPDAAPPAETASSVTPSQPAAEQASAPTEPAVAAARTAPTVKAAPTKRPAKPAVKIAAKAAPKPAAETISAEPPLSPANPAPAPSVEPAVAAPETTVKDTTSIATPKKSAAKPLAKPAVKSAKAKPSGLSAEAIREAIARGKAETGVSSDQAAPAQPPEQSRAPADKTAKPDATALQLRGSLHP